MNNNTPAMMRTALEIYEYLCHPVCELGGIQQGELNVLLFLANNEGKNTAIDVHKSGGMKQSMISTLVEKLVQGGYLEREKVPGDRRKVKLVCTEKAAPVIAAGQEAQKKLRQYMLSGIAPEDIKAWMRIKEVVERNVMDCREKMLKGELE